MRLLVAALLLTGGSAWAQQGAWRPLGGAPADRAEPSTAIFPTQRVPLRYSHRTHVRELGIGCTACHARAASSDWASHDLLPQEEVCRRCHPIDHDQPTRETDPPSRCDYCHVGWEAAAPRRVEVVQIPRPNVRFPHSVHLEDRVPCTRCHGDVGAQDMATRANLPTMRTCFECHDGRTASQACSTCHLLTRSGVVRTSYPEGTLLPPRWMHGASHDAAWTFRHRRVAGDDSEFCGNCHLERECLDCHDGRVRDRTVHPNDWLTTHPVSARRDDPACRSCHRAQSFCLGCHRRAGVAQSSLDAPFASFHLGSWMQEGPGHHRFEARRNLQACISCHAESDCVGCHGAFGVGAGGSSMFSNRAFHEPGFAGARCRGLRDRNSRPCLVCHRRDDPDFVDCE